MTEATALAKEFSTPARRIVHSADGKIVLDLSPLTRPHTLKIQELRFQHYFRNYFEQVIEGKLDFEEALGQAAEDAQVSVGWADRYLRSGRYKRWLADRMAEWEVVLGITPKYIALLHKRNVEGKIKLTSTQQVSLSELGDRVWPKVQKVEHKVQEVEGYSMDELTTAQKDVEALEAQVKASEGEGPRKTDDD